MCSAVKEAPIRLQSDLVGQARHHMAFLQAVWRQRSLWERTTLKNAVHRYRTKWLPLLASTGEPDLDPPLDIHWVWYLHMKQQTRYHSECQHLVGEVPPHRFRFLQESRETVRGQTMKLWREKFPGQEYDMPVDAVKDSAAEDPDEPLVYLIQDLQLEKSFIYQILLPHYIDPLFLSSALERYKLFLQTRRSCKDFDVAPVEIGYDIELLYRTHMATPLEYKSDMIEIFGEIREFVVPPNASALEHGPLDLPLLDGLVRVPGAMFRGDPLFSKMSVLSADDIYRIAHKECRIGIKRIRVEHINFWNIVLVIGIAKWTNSEIKRKEFYSRGKAPYEWSTSDGYLMELDWRSEGFEQFYLSCFRRSPLKGRKPKALIGCLFDKLLFEHLEATTLEAGNGSKELCKAVTSYDCEARFTVAIEISGLRRLSTELWLQRGDFEPKMIPEHIRDIWGPFMLESLPRGVSNTCSFALHKFLNHRDDDVFHCRVLHSLPLRMSAVEILYRDRMITVAHLVENETCPTSEQVQSEFTWPTLNPARGERAMIIKNARGDWGMVVGSWKTPSDSTRTTIDEKSLFSLKAWDFRRHRQSCAEVSLRNLKKNYAPVDLLGVDIDIKSGRVKIPMDVDDVAESLALAMAAAVLLTLCLPSTPRASKRRLLCCQPDVRVAPDLQMLWAAGFMTKIPSNEWLRSSRVQKDGTLKRLQSTAWKEYPLLEPGGAMAMYSWKKPDGMPGRQDSFDVEIPSGGGLRNVESNGGNRNQSFEVEIPSGGGVRNMESNGGNRNQSFKVEIPSGGSVRNVESNGGNRNQSFEIDIEDAMVPPPEITGLSTLDAE